MAKTPGLRGLGWLSLVAIVAAGSAAQADDAAAPPATSASEAPSLQGFDAQERLCREWSDGCSICLRDETATVHCSLPGIACQPAAIVCRRGQGR